MTAYDESRVRRFEPGTAHDLMLNALKAAGVDLHMSRGPKPVRLNVKGEIKRLTLRQLMAYADDIRLSEGKEPVCVR